MALADTYVFPKDVDTVSYAPKALPWAVVAKKGIVSRMSVAFKQKFPEIVDTKNYAKLAEQVVEVPNEFDELRLDGLSSNLGVISLYAEGKIAVCRLSMNLARLHWMLSHNTLVNNSLKGNLRLEILQAGVDIYNLDLPYDAARYNQRRSNHKLTFGDEVLHISGKTGIYLGVKPVFQVKPSLATYNFHVIVTNTEDGYQVERSTSEPENWTATGTNRMPSYDEMYFYQSTTGHAMGQQLVLTSDVVPFVEKNKINSQHAVVLQTKTQRYLMRQWHNSCIPMKPDFQIKDIFVTENNVAFDAIGEVLFVEKPYILHPDTQLPCYF